MKPPNLNLTSPSTRNYLLALIAVAALAITLTFALRPGTDTAPVAADSVAAPSSAPATAGFIKFDGIDGESKDASHENWIELTSVSHGITRPISGGISGSTRQRSAATFGDVVVVKEVDKSTPRLQEAIAKGMAFPTLTLDLTDRSADGRSSEPYLKWELKNVIVTGYRISGSTDGDVRPTETISLNFEEIKVTYTEQNADGSKGGNIEYSWKVEEGAS